MLVNSTLTHYQEAMFYGPNGMRQRPYFAAAAVVVIVVAQPTSGFTIVAWIAAVAPREL